MRNKALFVGLVLAMLWTVGTGCASSPKTPEPPAVWKELNAGMTRGEIAAKLGPPAGRPGLGQDLWFKGRWELYVTYDPAGRASTIVRRLRP